jgi:two-component system phosphate regulon sensor histidine kinase PhoR
LPLGAILGVGSAAGLLGGLVLIAGFGAPAAISSLAALLLGVLAAALVWFKDQWRHAQRAMTWLQDGALAGSAPEEGWWSELAYRVQRLLREREFQIQRRTDDLAQFFDAIEASPNGVLLLGPDEAIVWCNTVAAQHFGLDPLRDREQRLTHLVRTPAFVAYLQAQQFAQPVVFTAPGGQVRLSVLVRPYGQGMKLVLSQDITERERAEAMRRDFVANVSHEIRTPLTVVSGFLETMADLPLSEAERKRVLLLMQQQTQRMQHLVGDLLTLAQLEGSPSPGADRWVPAALLLQRALVEAKSLSSGRHQFDTVLDEHVEIAGSESELLSAISNLLNNAVRYTPEGGQIWLRWRARADGGATIEVQDTGPGIAREHLPRLTERFYRVDGSRSRDTGGTGLGLSIVKHVAQRHGGEIEVQSELGRGSSFRLHLPALRVRARQPVAAAQA